MDVEIIFQSKSRDRGQIRHTRHGRPTIFFRNGQYKTSNREQINELLNSDLMKRGYIEPVTPPEVIEKWLLGETPDRLTRELLDEISDEGVRELAKFLGFRKSTHNGYPEVIRAMLVGEPMTNEIGIILNKFEDKTKEKVTESTFQKAKEAGIVYRNGPWYKYRKGDEEDPNDDLSLGRSEAEAEKWCRENKDKFENRLENVSTKNG